MKNIYILCFLFFTFSWLVSCKKENSINSSTQSEQYLILNDGVKSDTFNIALSSKILIIPDLINKYSPYIYQINFLNNKTNNTKDSITQSQLKIPILYLALPPHIKGLTTGKKALFGTYYNDNGFVFKDKTLYTVNSDGSGSSSSLDTIGGELCLFNNDYFYYQLNHMYGDFPGIDDSHSFDATYFNANQKNKNNQNFYNNITYVGPVQFDKENMNKYYFVEGEFISQNKRYQDGLLESTPCKTYKGKYKVKVRFYP